MTKKEAKQIVHYHNKTDNVYTTHTHSVDNFDGFLRQCKRAINKMQQIPDASVKHEFFSMMAVDQAMRFYKKEIDGVFFGFQRLSVSEWKENPKPWYSPCIMNGTEYYVFDDYKEKYEEYEAIKKMTYWEYLRKYGELHVENGWNCVDFEFDGIVFAALSSQALVEMGAFTAEECKQYQDAYRLLNDD